MYQALQQGAQNPQEEMDGGQMMDEEQQEMKYGGEKNSLWKNIRENRGSGKAPTKEMLEQERKIKRNAQEGGKLQYAEEGLFFKANKYAKPTYDKQPFIGGMTSVSGDMKDFNGIKERMSIQNQDLPYIIGASKIYEDNTPNMNGVGDFQKLYDEYVNAILNEIDQNSSISDDEKKRYKEIATKQLLGLSKKSGTYDKVYGDETSTRTKFTLPYITKKDREKYGSKLSNLGDVLDDKGNIKADYSELDESTKKRIQDTYKRQGNKALNIGLGEIKQATATTSATEEATTEKAKTNRPDRVVIPNIPTYYGQAPTPPEPVYKGDISLDRMNPNKISIEPNLVEAQRQMMGAQGSLEGLSPTQRAVAMQNMYTQNQNATNQAISNAQMANMGSQMQVDQFNIGQSGKERLANLQNALSFEQRNLGTKAKYEANLQRYFNNIAAVDKQNWQDVNNLNYLNAKSDNFQTDGTNFYRTADTPQIYNSVGQPTSKITDKESWMLADKAHKEQDKKLKAEAKRLGLK
jgi:hypothetical protein